MTNLVADVRFAVRSLQRSPWFAVLCLVTLGVGIGATTALFSLVDAVLFRPLPFSEPHRLVEIWGRNDERTGMRVPLPILEALRTHSKTLQAIGTHDPSGGVIAGADGAISIRGEAVSANFTDVFGVQPLFGRPFVSHDASPNAPAVMLISFVFWQRHFGADPAAVGRVVDLDAIPYTVIGVMPAGFRTTFVDEGPMFWTASAGNRSRERERELGYELVARLAPGATVEQARSELDAIASGVVVDGWGSGGRRIGLVPLRHEVVGDRAYALQLLLAAVGVVLVVACANLAQLLLARSERRVTEFATRKAIGARTGQLFRLALCESVFLSLAGGAAGCVLAYVLLPVMLSLAPVEIPRLVDASIDERVLAAALAISLLTGCMFGAAPAWRLSRLSLAQAVKPALGLSSPDRARLRSALVVLQVAAAVALFALAGLVVQTFFTLLPASPGFATDSRAAFIWSFDERQFPDAADRRRRVNAWMEQLRATPGIVSVAIASAMPFGDDEPRNVPVRDPEDLRPPDAATLRADYRSISPNYFELLQIPLVHGRAFTATDRVETPRVAIVNQTLARRLEPSGDVIGHSIRVGTAAASPLLQIVGIAADTRWWGMTLDPLNEVYTPLSQDRAAFGFLIVQSPLGVVELTGAIRRAFHAVAPGAALPPDRSARTLDELIGRSIAGPRFSATLIAAFSATTLMLAGIGLFGMVAYSVAQRRRELGIRCALGARPRELVAAAMRSAIVLTLVGIVVGLAAAAVLTRFVQSQLYAIEPLDPQTFGGAAVVMTLAAAVAAYLPARRAVQEHPMSALRQE